jgi:hypothetical protein
MTRSLALAGLLIISTYEQTVSKGPIQLEQAQATQAAKLWEAAVEAKGGRQRLHQVKSLAVFYEASKGRPSVELYEFPDKLWMWFDTRPSKFGLYVEALDYSKNLSYMILGGPDGKIQKLDTMPNKTSFLEKPQLIHLLESAYFKPELLSTYKTRLGFKPVDVVVVRMDKFRAGVFLDAKTHLPLRIGYYFKEAGGELFKWYDLSGYREVEGIKLPSVIVEDDRIKKEVRYEINPKYDPQVFERPPSVKGGPEQWRLKREP